MCRSSRHLELATYRLSTAFGERDDMYEQVMEAEQQTKTSLPRAIQEIAMAMRFMLYLRYPVGMAEPGPRGPVVPSELRSAILQHGPCRLKGPLAISRENGNRCLLSEKHQLHISQSSGRTNKANPITKHPFTTRSMLY